MAQDLLFLEEFIDPGIVSQERVSAASSGCQLVVSCISFESLSAVLERDPAMRQDFYQHAALDLALHLKRLGPHAYGKNGDDKSGTTKLAADPRKRRKKSGDVSKLNPGTGKTSSQIFERRLARRVSDPPARSESSESAGWPRDESMELISDCSEEEVEGESEETTVEEDWQRWAVLF